MKKNKSNTQLLFTHHLTVPFYDVDSLHIVWHGHYVKYLEEARCAWLADMNYSYLDMRDDNYYSPIVKLDLKYLRPATFGQTLHINIYLVECESALKLNYLISNDKGDTLCKANTMQAIVRFDTQETQYQVPEKLLQRIAQYLEKG